MSHGLFSAVTGIRRFGDLANNNNNNNTTNAASGNGANGASAKLSTLKKRTFSEVGKLGSTVAAQQFVFGAGDTLTLYKCYFSSNNILHFFPVCWVNVISLLLAKKVPHANTHPFSYLLSQAMKGVV